MALKQIYSIVMLIGISLVIGCSNPELEKKVSDLEAEKESLIEAQNKKDSAINDFIVSFNEIEQTISEIDDQQSQIDITIQNGIEGKNQQTSRILNKIQFINTALENNEDAIQKLSNQLSRSNLNVKALSESIERLKSKLASKTSEITDLKSKLQSYNFKIEDLNTSLDSLTFIAELQRDVIELQRDELETAFYCFGTKKELKAQNVISKEGGVVGLGKTIMLAKDFNKEYFTKINIATDLDIPIAADKIEIITPHPTESYSLIGENKVEKLTIKEPVNFWSASKYLVIIVE